MKLNRNKLKNQLTPDTKEFLSNIENNIFWKGPEIIAQRMVDLIWGNGFTLTSSKDDLQNYLTEFSNFNDLEEIGRTISHWLSLQGRVIVIISKTKTGEFYLELADPMMTNKMGYVNQKEKIAVVYSTPFKDNKHWRVRTEMTDTYVKRTIQDTNDGDQEISIGMVNAKIPKEDQLEAEWKHNLGFLPAQEFLNKRMTPMSWMMKGIKTNYQEIADSFNGKDINNLINTIIREEMKETIINHTRVHGSFGPKEIQKVQANPEVAQDYMLNQLYLQAKAYGREGQGGVVNVDTNNLNILTYSEATTKAIGIYVNTAGLSSWFDGSDTGASQGGETATGVLAQRELDYTTITDKRRQFINTMTKLLDKLVAAKGLAKGIDPSKREYSFDLSTDLPMSPLQKIEMIRLRQEVGLITRDESIQELKPNMNEAELELYKKELDKDQEAEMIQLQEMGMGPQDNQDNNENPQPDKVGNKENK